MLISFSLPETQFIAETNEEATQKIRRFAALSLYQFGELSIGAACELAGIDRYSFLEFCKEKGVVLHTVFEEELKAEALKFETSK